jgi:rRNA maturation protein Nop10
LPSPQTAARDGSFVTPCRNCGAEAPWNYCPNCGQETQVALPSAFTFLRDAAGRYVRFDGRMWRSLFALFFRPGFLTREYLAGRRRRYVRPARLFVALSIVFFAVLRFSSPALVVVHSEGEVEGKAVAQPSIAGSSRLGFDVDPDLNLTIGAGAPRWLAPLRSRVDAFNRLPRDAKADQIVAGMFRYGPYAAIGLLPLFALLLQVVYAGRATRHPARPRRYAAHLVFAAHNHAYAFLAGALIVLVPFAPLRWLLFAWSLGYALLSLHGVYGGRWLGVAARAALVTLVYAVFFFVAIAALIVAAVALH